MSHEELQKIVASLANTMSATVTPYGLSKIVNSAFGIHLPPQMFYNYVRNNLIPVVEQDGKKLIEKKEALKFVERYGTRNIVSKAI